MKEILITQVSSWADSCTSSFVVSALKESYPEAKVTLLTGQSLQDWSVCLHYDDVILVEESVLKFSSPASIWELGKLAVTLRSRKFDLGIDLCGERKFGQLLRWGGISKTVGFEDDRRDLYDVAVPQKSQASDVDRILSLLAAISVHPKKLNFKLRVRQHVHEEILKKLAAIEIRSKNFFVVVPGGGENPHRTFHHKRWSHFSELIGLILERTKYPVLLLGGETDLNLFGRLTAVDPTRVHSLIGRVTKEESLAIIGEAFAFIGNDSGPAFVAGCAGTPSVVLFGPNSSRFHHPVGKDKTVVCLDGQVPCSPCGRDNVNFDWTCKDNACMKSISPEQVWSALVRVAQL